MDDVERRLAQRAAVRDRAPARDAVLAEDVARARVGGAAAERARRARGVEADCARDHLVVVIVVVFLLSRRVLARPVAASPRADLPQERTDVVLERRRRRASRAAEEPRRRRRHPRRERLKRASHLSIFRAVSGCTKVERKTSVIGRGSHPAAEVAPVFPRARAEREKVSGTRLAR
eukprot:23325-Pelagococcus_subviridis.AAC.2